MSLNDLLRVLGYGHYHIHVPADMKQNYCMHTPVWLKHKFMSVCDHLPTKYRGRSRKMQWAC